MDGGPSELGSCSNIQSVLNDEPPKLSPNFPFSDESYLYALRNTKPLDKLIYLDGASAAKTLTGEMDQQLVLSRQLDPDARVDERVAASKICE